MFAQPEHHIARQRNKPRVTTTGKNSVHAEHRISLATGVSESGEKILQTTASGRQSSPCPEFQSCDCLPPTTPPGSHARQAVTPRQRWTGPLLREGDTGCGASK